MEIRWRSSGNDLGARAVPAEEDGRADGEQDIGPEGPDNREEQAAVDEVDGERGGVPMEGADVSDGVEDSVIDIADGAVGAVAAGVGEGVEGAMRGKGGVGDDDVVVGEKGVGEVEREGQRDDEQSKRKRSDGYWDGFRLGAGGGRGFAKADEDEDEEEDGEEAFDAEGGTKPDRGELEGSAERAERDCKRREEGGARQQTCAAGKLHPSML